MNAKKSKAIRKLLKTLNVSNTVDPNVIDVLSSETTYTENLRNRKMIKFNDVNEAGDVIEKAVPISAGTISLNPKCERGLYKHLKSQIK